MFQPQQNSTSPNPVVLVIDFPPLPSDPAQMPQWYETFKTKLVSELSVLVTAIGATQAQVSALQAQLQSLTNT